MTSLADMKPGKERDFLMQKQLHELKTGKSPLGIVAKRDPLSRIVGSGSPSNTREWIIGSNIVSFTPPRPGMADYTPDVNISLSCFLAVQRAD